MFTFCYQFNKFPAVLIVFTCFTITYASFNDWQTIETLAENHPYIVALLNETWNYTCSGVILNQRVVLTSGHCVFPEPIFVVVGCAAIGNMSKTKNIFDVAFTRVHEDYMYEMNDAKQNITRMHSNLALVFTVKPLLLHFIESAVLGNYFESELKNKILYISGYGKLDNSDLTILQTQKYKQLACTNPKWYYCICGKEYYTENEATYDLPFGEGAPVFYRDEVVGITACPAGMLVLNNDIDYNIFTVITPYITWITKTQTESNNHSHQITRSSSDSIHPNSFFTIIFSISIKIFTL